MKVFFISLLAVVAFNILVASTKAKFDEKDDILSYLISSNDFQKNVENSVPGYNKLEPPLEPSRIINAIALNSRMMLPDMGNTSVFSELTKKAKLAIEGHSFLWQDIEFQDIRTYSNKYFSKCELLVGRHCRIWKYIDPLDSNVILPSNTSYPIEGTILAKVAGASGYLINGTAFNSALMLIEQTNEPLTQADAKTIFQTKMKYFHWLEIDVISEALYDVPDGLIEQEENEYPTSHHILSTAPLSYDKKRPITNEPYFTVADFNLEYMFRLSIQLYEEAKIETFQATYLTPHRKKLSRFNVSHFCSASFLNPSKLSIHKLKKWEKSLDNLYSSTATLFYCTGNHTEFCKDTIHLLKSRKNLKSIFVITDSIQKWNMAFPDLGFDVILFLDKIKEIKTSLFFTKVRTSPLTYLSWKINYTSYLYPNPKVSTVLIPGLEIKPDVMAIGGPFHAPSLFPELPGLGIIPSSAEIANARFAGMLAMYIQKWKAKYDFHQYYFQGREAPPKRPTHEDALQCAQNTATPYIYGQALPEHMKVTDFAMINDVYAGYAMPVPWQGAGLVNIEKMMHTEMHVLPSKLELGYSDSSNIVKSAQLIIENRGPFTAEYKLEHVPAVGLKLKEKHFHSLFIKPYMVMHMEHHLIHQETNATANKIILQKNSAVTLNVTFYLPTTELLEPFIFFSGYLRFNRISLSSDFPLYPYEYEYPDLHVPYLLLYGNIEDYMNSEHASN